MESRIKPIRRLSIAAVLLLVFASVGFAQYTMELTGVGDGANANDVYVSPYNGSIWTGAYSGGPAPATTPLYSGYVICDDFTDESYIGDIWNATATNAASVNANVLFTTSSSGHSVQDNYNAVAWLANQLLLPANVTDWTAQTNYSFAIWDIMDGQTTDPDHGAASLITLAFTAVSGGYQGSNVTVYTPAPNKGIGSNVSQEFLVINTPEASLPATLAVQLSALVGVIFLMRRRLVKL